ncbi:MAG: IS4 family transposase, partial [Herbaspirillum sp.]
AYRFFSNPKVNEADILSGHLGSTRDRVARTSGPVLVLHDTTEFSYKRDDIDAIGITHEVSSRRTLDGRVPRRVVCGVLMHSSLAVTTEGLPLGIAAIKFWTRKKFKGAQALQRKVNPTRVPIEQKESLRWLQNLQQSTALLNVPERCVHIGDRESDIYELFCAARDAGTHFLFRTCVDRVAGDGTHTIAHEMKEIHCKGLHHLKVQDKKGNSRHAVLELRYRRLRVLPPVGKRQRYPALTLTVIHAHERNPASGCDSIDWKLITDLPVRSRADAIEKLQWYALRWKIEVFHKILKSGCRAEDSKLRTAQRLVNLIAMFCLLSWRIFWLTMINRSAPEASPRLAFTELELKLLDHFMAGCDKRFHRRRKLGDYLVCLARLGGYLARTSDPPPGNMVIWRGLSRLTDISLGATIEARIVGN